MEDTKTNIQTVFDSKEKTVDEQLIEHRAKWTNIIKELNEQMKDLPHLDELQNKIYSVRQDAVDYYYAMNAVILNQTKQYRKSFNDKYNAIKVGGYNGVRYSNDQAIARQIETTLEDKKELIDVLTNQNNYMKDTISTIDNIIYGIQQKVKIKELLNGLKF